MKHGFPSNSNFCTDLRKPIVSDQCLPAHVSNKLRYRNSGLLSSPYKHNTLLYDSHFSHFQKYSCSAVEIKITKKEFHRFYFISISAVAANPKMTGHIKCIAHDRGGLSEIEITNSISNALIIHFYLPNGLIWIKNA